LRSTSAPEVRVDEFKPISLPDDGRRIGSRVDKASVQLDDQIAAAYHHPHRIVRDALRQGVDLAPWIKRLQLFAGGNGLKFSDIDGGVQDLAVQVMAGNLV